MKLSAKVIGAHFTYVFNRDISLNVFFNPAKTASVRPIFEKKDQTNNEN